MNGRMGDRWRALPVHLGHIQGLRLQPTLQRLPAHQTKESSIARR